MSRNISEELAGYIADELEAVIGEDVSARNERSEIRQRAARLGLEGHLSSCLVERERLRKKQRGRYL